MLLGGWIEDFKEKRERKLKKKLGIFLKIRETVRFLNKPKTKGDKRPQ